MLNIAVFISGRGSNLKALERAIETKELDAVIGLVVSSDENAPGYLWAKEKGIPAVALKSTDFQSRDEFVNKMLSILTENKIEFIVLAGYIKKIPKEIIEKYRHKIINIHPALLPYFGGKGFYGINVHRAVVESKAKYSGISIHFVDENYDTGPIIIQVPIPIEPGETPESLEKRISSLEHKLYYKILRLFTNGNILNCLTKNDK